MIPFTHLSTWRLTHRIFFRCFDRCSYENEKSIYLALHRLMNIPEYIGLYHIKATFLCFSNEFWPHLQFFENFLRRKGITETCSA